MAIYGALTDAFREFNSLLIHQQGREDALALQDASRKHKDAVLQSQLEQQNFNNTMARSNLELQQKGESRLAKNQQESLRRWNIQNIRNEEIHENLKGSWGDDKEQRGLQIAKLNQDMEISNLQKDELTRQAELNARATDKSDVDFNNMLTEDQLSNPDVIDDIESLLNREGMTLGEDGKAHDNDGNVVQMKNYQQAGKLSDHIQSVVDQNENRASDVAKKVVELEDQYKQLKEVASAGTDNYNLAERAQAKRQMNKLTPEIQLQRDYFKPENMLSYHNDKVIQLQKHAGWLRGIQEDDRADAMDKTIANHRNIAAAIEKDMAEAVIEGGEPAKVSVEGLKQHSIYDEKTGKYVGQATYDVGKAAQGQPAWSYVDGEGVPTTNQTELESGTQVGKPTDKSKQTGYMTENQMTNIAELYQSEGMDKIFASDAIKPKLSNLKTVITSAHRNLGGKQEDRAYVKAQVVQKVEDLESWYHEQVEPINDLSKKQRRVIVRKLGIKTKKNQTAKQALENYYYGHFRDSVRQVAGDDKMRIYRPNKTTRKMNLGYSGFGG